MRKVKAALFDLDGTLIDSETQYTNFWGATGREFASDIPDFALRIKGTTLPHILSTYFPYANMQREIIELLNAFEAKMEFPIIDGAEEFIHNLKANGVKCAIVTSSNKAKMENVWRQQEKFMNMFDLVLTSEDFAASKPNPDCYLKAAERLETDISECMVFEDAFTGLEAGMCANIYTVGLTTENSRDKIVDKCNKVIDDFRGLNYDIINNWLNE